MKYILNPYAQIMKKDNENYVFFQPPSRNSDTAAVEMTLNEYQTGLLDMLMRDGEADETDLQACFGSNMTALLQNDILVENRPDIVSVLSRTRMYYLQFLSQKEVNMLSHKRVLLLGCGGIGSSLAWLLASSGIRNLTILDFDTVEYSNLNRMFCFDKNDVGRKKVYVMEEKLLQLFPDMNIKVWDMKLQSQEMLEKVCTCDKYDIIVKALDSPSDFPVWLDHVCKKHHLAYTTGITIRDRALVGPTYVPRISEIGWSDIIDMKKDKMEKVYGIIPSVSVNLFHITDLMAYEVLNVLLENYNALKYKGIISSENLFTGQVEYVKSTRYPFQNEILAPRVAALNFIAVVSSGICALLEPTYLLLAVIIGLYLPFITYSEKENILKQTFINTTLMSLFMTAHVLSIIPFGGGWFAYMSIGFVIINIANLIGVGINYMVIAAIVKIAQGRALGSGKY